MCLSWRLLLIPLSVLALNVSTVIIGLPTEPTSEERVTGDTVESESILSLEGSTDGLGLFPTTSSNFSLSGQSSGQRDDPSDRHKNGQQTELSNSNSSWGITNEDDSELLDTNEMIKESATMRPEDDDNLASLTVTRNAENGDYSNSREPMHKRNVWLNAEEMLRNKEGFRNSTNSTSDNEDAEYLRLLLERYTNSSYSDFSSSCSEEETLPKLCSCSSSCSMIENCCIDSEFVANERAPLTYDTKPYSCYSQFRNKWKLSPPSRLVDQCLDSWQDVESREACERPDPDDILSLVPCYSPISRLSYRNRHCLQCNGLNDCSQWEVTFQSSRDLPLDAYDSWEKINEMSLSLTGYRFQLYFALSPLSSYDSAHCTPEVINNCHPQYATEELSRLCQSYYKPVLIAREFYRNIHCFICSTDAKEEFGVRYYKQIKDTQLSVLLNIAAIQPQARLRNTHCKDGHCDPKTLIRSVEGFTHYGTVYIAIKVPDTDFPISESDIIQINRKCKSMLNDALEDAMGDVKHQVTLYKYRLHELHQMKPYRFRVQVLQHIPLDKADQLSHATDSIGFQININDTIPVACCFDEDGNKLGRKKKHDPQSEQPLGHRSDPRCSDCEITPTTNETLAAMRRMTSDKSETKASQSIVMLSVLLLLRLY